MEQFFTLVGDLGLPIAGTIGLGAFIYIIIKYILSSVVGSITFMDNVITQLDNRVKTMNNDIIQIDQLIAIYQKNQKFFVLFLNLFQF